MWNQITGMHKEAEELKALGPKRQDYEDRFQREVANRELVEGELSLEEKKRIARPLFNEYNSEVEKINDQITPIFIEVKCMINEADLSQAPRTEKPTLQVGRWSSRDFISSLPGDAYARYRAIAEKVLWEALGFQAEVVQDGCLWKCLIDLDIDLELANVIKTLHMNPHKWVTLIWDALPSCNVQTLLCNFDIPNRWDSGADKYRAQHA